MLCVVSIIVHSCVFFNQKTAYEMRISDWSSDVCSSDLAAERRLRHVGETLDRRGVAGHHQPVAHAAAFLHQTGRRQVGQVEEHLGPIGRASCRERVCQYGVDLGGRRIIKKKTTIVLQESAKTTRKTLTNKNKHKQ